MQAKTLMKKFLIDKGLWEEFTRYYTEVKLEGLYVKKEKLPTLAYTPRISRTQRKERNEKIVKLREEGLTYREIGDKIGMSYESIRLIIDSYTK